jgi:Domain of unknown function (DUF222)
VVLDAAETFTDTETDAGALESRACELSAHIHAATAELSRLLASFDASGAWYQQGTRSCAHWLSLTAGFNAHTGAELVRVGHALEGLPRLAEAFGQGRLSLDKVRAVTQVATAADEHVWVELALAVTASQLGRICREYRLALEVNHPEAAERRLARRGVWAETTEDGMLRIVALLPPEEGELVLQAIEAARQGRQGGQAAAPAGTAESGQPVDLDADQDEQLSPALDDAIDGGLDDELAGDEAVDLEPDLDLDVDPDAVPEPPEPVPDPAEDPHAAGRAGGLVAVCQGALTSGAAGERGDGATPHQVVVHVDAGLLTGEQADGRCQLEGGMPLALSTVRRLGCDCEVLALTERDGLPLDVGRRRRTVPRRLRRALEWRDRTCRFPGCLVGSRRSDDHHLLPWYLGGATDLRNLLKLCRFHHARVHDGVFTIVDERGGDLRFETAAGREIGVVNIAVEPGGEWGEGVRGRSRREGLAVDAMTSRALDGGPLDYEYATSVLADACQLINARAGP